MRIAIRVPAAVRGESLSAILPPGHALVDPDVAEVAFGIAEGAGGFSVTQDGALLHQGVSLADALTALDGEIRETIAARSPEYVFVHAGVVALNGRGLVLPGSTFAGKTELVTALLRAGADYLSDEFAVLDQRGHVHPYPRRLSLRERGTFRAERLAAQSLGAQVALEPVPVKLIAVTQYQEGARWEPVERSPALGAVHLLAHCGQARRDPERTLRALHGAAKRALILEGPRGEAEPAAQALLGRLQP